MDKNKIISIFSKYAQSFDLNNQMIAQKFQHSINVANYTFEIANFLLLDENLKSSAFLIGLLHEIGSFKAITENSPKLRDKLTIDFLFKENNIESFTQDKTQISLIKKTLQMFIKNKQNTFEKIQLKNNTQTEKTITLLSILKDADTLELFGMFKRKTIAPLYDLKFTKKSFSKNVLSTFKSENKVQFADVNSNLDKILLFVSLFFELNYSISKNLAIKIDFIQGIADCYTDNLSEIEKQKLEKVLNTFKKKFYVKD